MTGFDRSKEPADKAKQYFNRPGFNRMLTLVWAKYAVWGKAAGQITVKLAQAEECEAINEFFGTYHKPKESISIRLKVLEQELQDSAFPFSIPDLHQILEGFPLLTRLEKDTIRQEKWQQLFLRARAGMEERNLFIGIWLTELEACKAAGYRTLLEQFEADPGQALIYLQHAVKVLEILLSASTFNSIEKPAGVLRLPYLAVRVTGDSHALDLKRPAGRLLYYALHQRRYSGMDSELNDILREEPQDGEESAMDTLSIREVYRSAGIADDDLSTIVYVYVPEQGVLPAPMVWTLRQIDAMELLPTISSIYIVENPPVFSMLLDAASEWLAADGRQFSISAKPPMLVCSSGPASAAALRLFQRLIEAAEQTLPIYYSGDYDVKGLEMGTVLAGRFSQQFSPWRFDTETYLQPNLNCPTGPEFTQAELDRLFRYKAVWDEELTQAMHKNQFKMFQETLMPLLVKDWIKVLSCESN